MPLSDTNFCPNLWNMLQCIFENTFLSSALIITLGYIPRIGITSTNSVNIHFDIHYQIAFQKGCANSHVTCESDHNINPWEV